jgi:hypothetical protein
MKFLIKYFVFLVFTLLISTCKKKTTITVKLLNPALNEYVADATIVLVERKAGGVFSKDSECKEIASAVTNNNGECTFDKEKLRSGSGYDYFCAVKESWGLSQSYPCEGIADRFIKKGGTSDWLLTDYVDTYFTVKYANIFQPGTSGDSLIFTVDQGLYYDPIAKHNQGGGGVGGLIIDYNTYYPFPNISTSSPVKIFANKLILKTRKRKMGIVTTSIDTIKAYPNKTTIIEVNW